MDHITIDKAYNILPIIQRWLYSGCGILVLLLVHGYLTGCRPRQKISLAASLVLINSIYAVATTSWLLFGVLKTISYAAIPLVCLIVSPAAGRLSRRALRRILRGLSFTDHKIAYFHPPALRIDTEVEGLFVVRGLTFTLADLTVEAHGIELGMTASFSAGADFTD